MKLRKIIYHFGNIVKFHKKKSRQYRTSLSGFFFHQQNFIIKHLNSTHEKENQKCQVALSFDDIDDFGVFN